MPGSEVAVSVLSPRGDVRETAQVPASRRLSDLSGKRIGVLNNGKAGGEMLLPYLEKALESRLSTVQLRRWLVHFALDPDIKQPALAEIAAWSDAVIALTGD